MWRSLSEHSRQHSAVQGLWSFPCEDSSILERRTAGPESPQRSHKQSKLSDGQGSVYPEMDEERHLNKQIIEVNELVIIDM